MKRTLAALFVLVIILGATLAVYSFLDNEASAPSTSTGQTISRDNLTFTYPEDFGLAVTPEQILVRSYIPPCDTPFDYCFYYNGSAYASSTFESAGVRISKRADLVTRESCLAAQPGGYTGLVPRSKVTGDYATSVFSPLSDAAAGHYAHGELYRISYSGGCYEFETRVGESQYQNYEPGTVAEFTPQDRLALQGQLRRFLESVTFTDSGAAIALP